MSGKMIVTVLALTLSFPAEGTEWMYWRANNLKPLAVVFTTDQGTLHTIPVSVCAPGEDFVCLRFGKLGALAVPKGRLPHKWEFEGLRYEVVERDAAMGLLGEITKGAYIKTSGPASDAFEFFYSPMRGFFAYQFISEGHRTIYISLQKCAPGALDSCREK